MILRLTLKVTFIGYQEKGFLAFLKSTLIIMAFHLQSGRAFLLQSALLWHKNRIFKFLD